MNPCPCGYIYDEPGKCTCSSSAIMRYRGRVSGPVYDRIDIHLNVRQVKSNEIVSGAQAEPSEKIALRVLAAREIQFERYKNEQFFTNAQIPPSKLNYYCGLSDKEQIYLRKIIQQLKISARGYSRILKIARTIADLQKDRNISIEHICAAIQFRCNDRI
jgi:Predicted ATPase with chaperone activity